MPDDDSRDGVPNTSSDATGSPPPPFPEAPAASAAAERREPEPDTAGIATFDDDDIAAALEEQFARATRQSEPLPVTIPLGEPTSPITITPSTAQAPVAPPAAPAGQFPPPPPAIRPSEPAVPVVPAAEPPALVEPPAVETSTAAVFVAPAPIELPTEPWTPPSRQAAEVPPAADSQPDDSVGREPAGPAPAEPESNSMPLPEPEPEPEPEPVPVPTPAPTAFAVFNEPRPSIDFDDLLVGSDEVPASAPSSQLGARQWQAEQNGVPFDPAAHTAGFTAATPVIASDFEQIFGFAPPTGSGAAGAAASITPSLVITPVRVPETRGIEPTGPEHRGGKPGRMFGLWFAPNASLLSVVLGAVVFALGLSLRQAIIAVLAGVVLSWLPLALGTLAGARSGVPALIASRATFGRVGNILPTLVGLAGRVLWGAALLWLLGAGTASILGGTPFDTGLDFAPLTLAVMAAALVIAALIALLGFRIIAAVQLALTIITAILVVGFIAVTAGSLDLTAAIAVSDAPWPLVITAAVLVFSVVGLAWATSAADLARYQRASTPGSVGSDSGAVDATGSAAGWAIFGTALPAFVLIAYGALLAASDPTIAAQLVDAPLPGLAALMPSWYLWPLVSATALSLLSGLVVTLYSGGFALQAVGLRVPRPAAVALAGVLFAAVAALFALGDLDLGTLFRDVATTLAVPVAAWLGIFGTDTLLRRRALHGASLLGRGGIYPAVRWPNTVLFVLLSVVGLGLTSATAAGLAWQGYLFPLFELPAVDALADTDIGVLVALALGLLVPLVSGIPAVRRQERAHPGATPGVVDSVDLQATEVSPLPVPHANRLG